MLIRNATLQMSATERACMDVRVMNGCVWEMGAALTKGLYESEIDLRGDVLAPGRMLESARLCARSAPAAVEKRPFLTEQTQARTLRVWDRFAA